MMFLSRRWYWLLVQILVALYTIASVGYLVYKPRMPWNTPNEQSDSIADHISKKQPSYYVTGPRDNPKQLTVHLPAPGNTTTRVNAGFVVLVRNSELSGMLGSMHDVESRFNRKFNYPWLFLNNEPFTEEFKQRTTQATNAKTYYGLVDSSMWSYPPWINQTHAAKSRERMAGLPYGKSESYRHMCRFQSGFFWRHPLLLELGWEYYWRVEPDVRYFCELDYDPFLYMKENGKQYAFTISFVENIDTVRSLWNTVQRFVKDSVSKGKDHFKLKAKDSLYRFVTDERATRYNACHFWTNFEIARVDLWHTDAYKDFFDYLDADGGFFYERWGDAPIHSIFASLYLRKDEIHYFHDIGYKHSIYQHCPESEELQSRCYCDPAKTLDYTDRMSCLNQYMNALQQDSPGTDETVGDLFIAA
ncbi:hypothetical protein LRAMOSA07695 [Lichtheimia ramosa]|uniref:Alpha 1,2-mannosyltransferase n=1 Tax=Lichtheimia ramosa TaxID=688394 RepID=A0A077WBQ4_9FUNG|nr:hypothetical protein LRAMOSA07695 [Lichtheimia ramosa]